MFVDESGFNTSMTRRRAKTPRAKRAYGKVPKNRDKNTTLIAAIALGGAMGTSMTVEGATDAEAFEAYVEHFLAPSLEKGQVVILDGLGTHRTQRIRELIEEKGADLVFLPPLLAGLEPHREEAFSKIKALVCKEGARVREVLAAITPEDAASWFAHAGSPMLAIGLRINPYEFRCKGSWPPEIVLKSHWLSLIPIRVACAVTLYTSIRKIILLLWAD